MSEKIQSEVTENLAELSLEGQDKTKLNDAQVLVKKGSGKIKVRKGQTEEAYLIQKKQFEESGPAINTENWLEEIDISKTNPNVKSDRARLEHLLERLYYKRNYERCLELSKFALDLLKGLDQKKIKNEIEELNYFVQKCTERLEQKE